MDAAIILMSHPFRRLLKNPDAAVAAAAVQETKNQNKKPGCIAAIRALSLREGVVRSRRLPRIAGMRIDRGQ
jgi:hypothetical protein